jgi:small subunit ribosomal protein S4
MARYTGPSTSSPLMKRFFETIKLSKKKLPSWQTRMAKKRGKKSEFAIQLMEKKS